MILPHLAYAEKIGSVYQDYDLQYCADDNTHTEIPTQKVAWACRNRSFLPSRPVEDVIALLFGEYA